MPQNRKLPPALSALLHSDPEIAACFARNEKRISALYEGKNHITCEYIDIASLLFMSDLFTDRERRSSFQVEILQLQRLLAQIELAHSLAAPDSPCDVDTRLGLCGLRDTLREGYVDLFRSLSPTLDELHELSCEAIREELDRKSDPKEQNND